MNLCDAGAWERRGRHCWQSNCTKFLIFKESGSKFNLALRDEPICYANNRKTMQMLSASSLEGARRAAANYLTWNRTDAAIWQLGRVTLKALNMDTKYCEDATDQYGRIWEVHLDGEFVQNFNDATAANDLGVELYERHGGTRPDDQQ